jgi:hypothetical protein
MDKVIADAENVDLSKEHILDITNNGCDVVVYHNLGNYGSIQDLLGEKGAVILLYEMKQNFGHWVAMFYTNEEKNEIEFFDSYGFAPDEELDYAKYDDQPFLNEMLKTTNLNIIHNKTRLQVFKHDVNTCGRWTAMRIVMRKTPLQTFVNLFKNKGNYGGDWMVSALTFLATY